MSQWWTLLEFPLLQLFFGSVNSNGLWWQRFLFPPKVFSRYDFGKEQARLLLKEVLLKVLFWNVAFLTRPMWSWWSVMICLLSVGLLKQSSWLELSDGISYRVIQSQKHRTLPNGSGCSGACARGEFEFECLWTSRVHGVCAGFSRFLMTGVDRVRAPPVTGVYIQILGQSWTAMKWDTNIFLYLSLSLFPPSLPDPLSVEIKQKTIVVRDRPLRISFSFLSRIFFFFFWQKYLNLSRFTKWHNLKNSFSYSI